MSCGEVREMLGAYVLGALEPAEADEARRHVETCPACAEEYAQLRPLPGLLDLVSVDEVTAPLPQPVGADTPGGGVPTGTLASDSLWAGLVRRVERERSGRRRRSVALAAGAVAAAGLLAFSGGLALSGGNDSTAVPTASPSTTSARDRNTGVHATVSFAAVGWGTKLTVAVGGVPLGEECTLVAVDASGDREVAASWRVPVSGYPHDGAAGTLSVPGAVGMQPSSIDRYEIITIAGEKLLTIPAHA
jgi:hypothetical protein